MQACVDRYLELCQPKFPKALQTVETPFLDESKPEFGVYAILSFPPHPPPIRGVRIESDPGSAFNAFINDTKLVDCHASMNEIKASENARLTIVIDSSSLPCLPPQQGHRIVQFDPDDIR